MIEIKKIVISHIWTLIFLYGWAKMQPSPYGEFCWVKNIEEKSALFWDLPEDSPVGYFLKVDLE